MTLASMWNFRPSFQLALITGALLIGMPAPCHSAENAALKSAMNSISQKELKSQVDTLADDVLEGREAGTRGGHAAATILRKQVEKFGLKPGVGEADYFQTFGADYRNLLVVLEGGDPKLRDEFLVVGAHYDHVGYGNSGNSFGPAGFIHNGADDNASGTAALMEVIEAFTQLDSPPKRSILFAFWDGEEKGLLGSRHWVENPTVPLKQVRLTVNTDMVGRLRKNRLEIGGTRTAVGLRRLISQANPSDSVWLDFTWKRQANSDHWPFFERKIPFLLFHTGLHDNYHRPSDDVHLINQEGLTEVSKCLFSVIYTLANEESLPKFRTAVHGESSYEQQKLESLLAPLPPRLGVQWKTANRENADRGAAEEPGSTGEKQDKTSDEPSGVLLTSVRFGTPASSSGLQGGDRILEFAGLKIEDGEHLRRVVSAATGETAVVLKRPGSDEPITLSVKLPESRVRVGVSWREDPAEPGTVIVTRVIPGSPAAEAGVKVRDRIYQVGGANFESGKELHKRLTTAASPVTILVERRGVLHEVELILDAIELPAREKKDEAPEASGGTENLADEKPAS